MAGERVKVRNKYVSRSLICSRLIYHFASVSSCEPLIDRSDELGVTSGNIG